MTGPGSLNNAVSWLPVSTTANVRLVSPAIGANLPGTPDPASPARTASPVTPPASPMTSTSLPRARRVRATFSALPPGATVTCRGRFTPDQSTPATWWVTSRAGLRLTARIIGAPGRSAGRQDDGPVEVAGPVGVQATGPRQRGGQPLYQDQLGHRVPAALPGHAARGGHLGGQPVRGGAQQPDHAARPGDRDRAVPVLHGRVGLGPHPGRLAQFERRLVGQAVGQP